jgi:hypothetical protein
MLRLRERNMEGMTIEKPARERRIETPSRGDMANLTTLVSFKRTNGSGPIAGLTSDAAGNLFGTTYDGGAYGYPGGAGYGYGPMAQPVPAH